MSQEYKPNGKGKSTRPQYMTVGSGSTSESAARLQALLDNDSGYDDVAFKILGGDISDCA